MTTLNAFRCTFSIIEDFVFQVSATISSHLVIFFLKILAISHSTSSQQLSSSSSRSSTNDLKSNEVFFLNLEDGFFGCQVNASVDVLQLFEVSKLCDGVPHCYQGSDENNPRLKCTSKLKPGAKTLPLRNLRNFKI